MRKTLVIFTSMILSSISASAIHGGRDAKLGELPSTVALAKRDARGVYKTFCSGTLISANTVLTAAHCYGHSDQETVFVVFSLDLKKHNLTVNPVTSWLIHEKWNEDSVNEQDPRDTHDLAILKFRGAVPITHKPAELLTDDSAVKRNTQILVAGYGFEKESMEQDQNGWPQMPSGEGVLRSARVKVADANFSATEVLTDEVKAGTTSADSGGSAFVRRGPKYHLWGVTSRGLPGQDGVYTRVSVFADWIRQNLKSAP